MNPNKTAVAVAVLACAVIGSSLWISSRNEPASAPVVGEHEPNTEFSETEANSSAEVNTSVQISDILSGVVVPEESISAESVPEEPEVSEPEESVSAESIPEVREESLSEESISEESEPVRNPLGNVTEENFFVTVTVTDEEGYPIENAAVTVDDVVGNTDANGVFTAETEDEMIVLHVVSEAYVSYYEELNLYDIDSQAEVSLKKADKIRRLINSAELRPYIANDAELDAEMRTLLGSLIEPGMDTYDKVKVCYDWLIANTDYRRPYHTGSGYWPCAMQTLEDGIGTCNCYSAAFALMMRYIGLECYVVEGKTSANGGGMTGHVWTVIRLDGSYYIFDPQVEDAMANRTSSKEVTYARFCLPEPHSKYAYSVNSQLYYIRNFDAYLIENGYFADLSE